MSVDKLQCPWCGELFDRSHLVVGRLIPTHTLLVTSATLQASTSGVLSTDDAFPLCPGSEQNPRNWESDKRPLWKDGGVS